MAMVWAAASSSTHQPTHALTVNHYACCGAGGHSVHGFLQLHSDGVQRRGPARALPRPLAPPHANPPRPGPPVPMTARVHSTPQI
eukprot:3671191-Pyramimonas_sp.AAC.1